jgi:hypothetical protein
MGRKEGEVLPADVVPCQAFQMSDRFREWAVAEMRKEVMGQMQAAGLDRMALLKRNTKGKDGNGADGGATGTSGGGKGGG